MWSRKLLLCAALLAASGCAVRQPLTYRLAPQGNARVLVPPGVGAAEVSHGGFTMKLAKRSPCTSAGDAIAVERRGSKLRVSVARDVLLQQPPGWLGRWAAEVENEGCMAPGMGLDFAMRVLESVPLDPAAAYR